MKTSTITEAMNSDNEEGIIKYTYIIGHGFGEDNYKAELIGRFGTYTEAEAHMGVINKQASELNGCMAFTKEFPFLIIEIVNVEFEKGTEKPGTPYKFYSFDWESMQYIESPSLDKVKVLDEYRKRANTFMQKLEESEQKD